MIKDTAMNSHRVADSSGQRNHSFISFQNDHYSDFAFANKCDIHLWMYLTPHQWLPTCIWLDTQLCETFFCVCWLDLCSAASKLISGVNASTNSIAFASCGGSGFYYSKHFNHKCEECFYAFYSIPMLPWNLRKSQKLLSPQFLSLENSCGFYFFTFLNCVITPVTIVKNSR